MIIQVTQEDIDEACPLTLCYCPIALAIFKKGLIASVGGRYISIHKDRRVVREFPLTEQLSKFIEDFDGNKKVKPFEFELPYELNEEI